MLSGASRDGGPTASTSQSDILPSILVQKCMRCDEKQRSIGSERRKKMLRWLLQSPEAAPRVADEDVPEIFLSPQIGSSIRKHHNLQTNPLILNLYQKHIDLYYTILRGLVRLSGLLNGIMIQRREILHMSTLFSTMRVMKPVAAIITLTISYFTESWGTLGEDSLLDTKLNIFLTTLVAAGGLVLSTMKSYLLYCHESSRYGLINMNRWCEVQSVAELMLMERTSALTYILLLLLKDVHILEEMVHAEWSSFFERRGGVGGSLTQETIGFHYVEFGLGFFCWERYQQWSVRGLRRSVLVTIEVQKKNKFHIQ